MSLTIRKIIMLGLIGVVFLMANVLVVANWLVEKRVAEKAGWLREEFLTGTAIAVIVALLILLVNPKGSGRTIGLVRRCPVCDKVLVTRGAYCSECGSKV